MLIENKVTGVVRGREGFEMPRTITAPIISKTTAHPQIQQLCQSSRAITVLGYSWIMAAQAFTAIIAIIRIGLKGGFPHVN